MSTSAFPDVQVDPRVFDRIRDEYQDMPGLSLTHEQARRLWALGHDECAEVLTQLVSDRVLRRTADGRYVCAASGPRRKQERLRPC